MRQTLVIPLLLGILILGGVACGEDDPPSYELDLAFYDTPDSLGAPGTLLRHEPMEPFEDGMRVWRVLYASEAVDGRQIAVSGIVAAPDGDAPSGGFDVVSWAHGTLGIVDRCTPSRLYRTTSHDFFDMAGELTRAGYVAVATDYEGLGTEGVHPYLLGPSEGRGQLDIVRAAGQLEDLEISNRVVFWGRSQGGHAALFAGEIAPTWAPELEVLGVIAAAPASELVGIVLYGPTIAGARGFMWQLTLGFEAAYAELSLEDVYDETTLATIRQLIMDDACDEDIGPVASQIENAGFATNPTTLPDWSARLEESSPGRVVTNAPILVLQGDADDVVPPLVTQALVRALCILDVNTDYRTFEGYSHDDSTRRNMEAMLAWTADRFAGVAATSTCE